MDNRASKGEKFYKNVLESLKDGVITLDRKMRVASFNPSMESMLGISAKQVLQKNFTKALPQLAFLKDKANHVIQSGETFSDSNTFLQQRHGHSIPVSIEICPLTDDGGINIGVVIVARDKGYLEDIQKADGYAERVDAFVPVASGIVHEIKNPLGGIRGAAQLLQEELTDDQLKEFARVIIKEVDRVNGLLDDLTRFSQPAELDLEKVNIHQVLDDVVMLETNKIRASGVKLSMNYDPSIPEITADRGKLMQLFINIVKNSLEAMPRGGTLTLCTKISDQYRVVNIKGRRDLSRMLLITVQDTGYGIPQENLDKVFTPYFTTKEGGSGLGLAISLHIAKQHGGRIKIESKPGRDTTVSVFLPLGTN